MKGASWAESLVGFAIASHTAHVREVLAKEWGSIRNGVGVSCSPVLLVLRFAD